MKKKSGGKKLDPTKSCLYCADFFDCNKINKGPNFTCDEYADIRKVDIEVVNKTEDKAGKVDKKKPSGKKVSRSKDSFDIIIKSDKFKEADKNPEYDFMADVHRSIDSFSNSPLPSNMEIDDTDAPMAANIFEFMTSDQFMGFTAFPRQLQFCVELLGEWCPRCSDPKWIENGWALKDTDDYRKVKRHIQLLEYGVCPKCGTTRKKLIKRGLLNPYVEGCGVIGQRCVTGDSLVCTSEGLVEIKKLHTEDTEGFYKYTGPDIVIETGEHIKPSLFFYKKGEPVYRITTEHTYITGTLEHPLKVFNGDYVKIRNLRSGDIITRCIDGVISPTKILSIEYAGIQDVYDFHIPQYHRFIANDLLNHNSGKSEISRQSFLYIQHKFLKLQKPASIYPGLTSTSKITFTVLAQTFAKAKRDLYDPLYAAYTQSKWFTTYHEILDHYGEKTGQELYRVKDTFASYRIQNIDVIPETPDTRNLRGATRGGAIMDELDWIDSSPDGTSNKGGKVRTDVEGIYTSVLNSFRTLRSGFDSLITGSARSLGVDVNIIPPPLMLCVSSPSSAKSLMMRNLKLSETSRYIYGMNKATWEVNPLITKESLSDEFRKSETNAMRDFGAVPPNSSFPFIEYMEDLSAICTDYKNALKCKTILMESNSGAVMTTGKVIFRQPRDNNNRIMAIDAGSVNNSFTMATGFWDSEEEEMVCDGMLEIIPSHENPINFNAIAANVIGTIVERMNITFLAADRWQSLKLLHDVEAHFDIDVEQYSLKYGDFKTFKSDIYDGHFKIPKCEVKSDKIEDIAMGEYPHSFEGKPVAHFMYQCITVRDLTKEVTKGIGLTDDMFRSVALLHSFISDHDYREYCTGVRMAETKMALPALGIVSSRGRAAGAIGAGGGGQAGGSFTASNGSILGIASSRRTR